MKEELDKSTSDYFILKNKLMEKDTQIILAKQELERITSQNNISRKEIYLADPTQVFIELYNELNCTRTLITSVSKLWNAEKIKNEKTERKFKEIQNEPLTFERTSPRSDLSNSESKKISPRKSGNYAQLSKVEESTFLSEGDADDLLDISNKQSQEPDIQIKPRSNSTDEVATILHRNGFHENGKKIPNRYSGRKD